MKLYKYIGPDVLELAFSEAGYVGFKCTYPKDYNDPYELFLTIDPNEVEPEILAYYQEILGELPQLPTTCFSNLPNVIPMWAHYACNSKGFVIEVDEETLLKIIPDISIADVDYKDEANVVDLDLVRRAYETGKPRHTYLLQRAAISNAYFTKNICWSYESERRLIVKDSDVTKYEDLMILSIPTECVTAIIAGPRSEEKLKKRCREICKCISCEYFEMLIGKSSIIPFFINTSKKSFLFNGPILAEAHNYCQHCGEPINSEDVFKCNWCTIDETQQIEAASRNPMRLLAKYGLLKDYVKDSGKTRKKS
jgi:hypothetical protein